MADPALVDLSFSRGGQLATLTIAEPKFNVLSTPVLDALLAQGLRLRRERGVRLVVLTGAGERSFIGGADIREMEGFDAEAALRFIDRVHQACHLFRALPVPSIARVNGYCLGAGMEVAACCDLRIGAESSHYGMPEVQLGMPSVVEAALLPTLIGWGRTRELLYTGAVIDAQTAYEIGFLERIAPLAGLDGAMEPWVEAILAAEPGAIRSQKQLIEGWLDSGVAAGVRMGMDAFSRTWDEPAARERVRDFLAQRKAAR